jgi:Protein of unknown function (DUF5818)
MRRRSIATVTLLAALAAAPAVLRAQGDWTGWITDESCGAKGANAGHRECALKCHRGGALLVLYDSSDGKLYKLDNQAAAEAHAGREVRVRGTLSGGAIQVTSIDELGG